MNTEKDIEKLFVEKLKNCGYPDACIIQVSSNRDLPGDIVIKNGKRYVQAFELKMKDNPEIRERYYSQYIGSHKIQLPVYFVIPRNGGFEYYDKDGASLDERDVLNYEAATNTFVQKAKKEIDKKSRCLRLICYFLFFLFCGADVFYFIKSICDSAYIWGTVAFAILTLFTLIVPFSKQFSIDLGDLGLEFVLNQETK